MCALEGSIFLHDTYLQQWQNRQILYYCCRSCMYGIVAIHCCGVFRWDPAGAPPESRLLARAYHGMPRRPTAAGHGIQRRLPLEVRRVPPRDTRRDPGCSRGTPRGSTGSLGSPPGIVRDPSGPHWDSLGISRGTFPTIKNPAFESKS